MHGCDFRLGLMYKSKKAEFYAWSARIEAMTQMQERTTAIYRKMDDDRTERLATYNASVREKEQETPG